MTNSGTNALFAAYFAISLRQGDEVIVAAHSFFAIASPLVLLGVRVIIVDCDARTGLIDTEDLKKSITENPKAVVINHLCGDSIDMTDFCSLMKAKKIIVIEDLSLAFGATYNGMFWEKSKAERLEPILQTVL